MSHYRHIHKTEQRHCDVGNYGWKSYAQYLTVYLFHLLRYICPVVFTAQNYLFNDKRQAPCFRFNIYSL